MHEGAPKRDVFKDTVDAGIERADEFLNEEHTVTRRQVGQGLVASGTTGVVLDKYGGDIKDLIIDTFSSTAKAQGTESTASMEISVENRERVSRAESELFIKQRDTFVRTYGTLTMRQIQFMDDGGAPLGAPQDVVPLNGIDPGVMNDQGVIAQGICAEWLNEARTVICKQHPEQACDIPNSLPRQTNSIAMVRLANERTKGLHAETLFDVVRHFGEQKVLEVPGTPTHIDYVRSHIGEGTTLPPEVVRDLQDIVPGLAAQESQYDSRALSRVNASGIFQFMPDTWKGLGFSKNDASLPNQVVGASRFFESAHSYFRKFMAVELAAVRETFFSNDEALFTKYFFVPILINSYNAGPARVATVLSWFVKTYPDKESFENEMGQYPHGYGYDLYATMAMRAKETKAVPGYGRDSSEYVVRAMAFGELIKERIPEKSVIPPTPTISLELDPPIPAESIEE